MQIGVEEDSVCNRQGCKGIIQLEEPDNCSCHINPPCSACMDVKRYCPVCRISEHDEDELWLEGKELEL